MNPGKPPSAPASGITSTDSNAAPVGESEYLERQAAAARESISSAFAGLKADLAQGVDPRTWVKSHPWMILASAAVAGFGAAAATIPSKEQHALRKLKALERVLHPEKPAGESHNGHSTEHKPESPGILTLLLMELMSVLKPVLLALLNARINPPPEAPAPQGATSQVDEPSR